MQKKKEKKRLLFLGHTIDETRLSPEKIVVIKKIPTELTRLIRMFIVIINY